MLLDIVQASQELSISRAMVRKLIALGTIQAVRIGRRVLIRRKELERFIARASQKPNSPPRVKAGVK